MRARIRARAPIQVRDRHARALAQLASWVREGKLSRNEHILEGADAAPGAIEMLYEGKNTGKLLVRVD